MKKMQFHVLDKGTAIKPVISRPTVVLPKSYFV